MHKRYILPLFALILSISGAAIRAAELYRAFEPDTGYHIQNSSYTLVMLIFTAVSVVIFGIVSVVQGDRTPKGYKLVPGSQTALTKVMIMGSGFIILVAALANLAVSVNYANSMSMSVPVSQIIGVLLAIFAAGSIMIRSVKPGEEYAFFSLVPVYWSCFWLIISYRDMSSNPVLHSYIFEMAAVIMAVLVFSRVAGYDFNSSNVRLSIFFGLCSVYFCTVAAYAPVIEKIIYGTGSMNISTTLFLTGGILFAFGWTCRLLTPKFEKLPEPVTEA